VGYDALTGKVYSQFSFLIEDYVENQGRRIMGLIDGDNWWVGDYGFVACIFQRENMLWLGGWADDDALIMLSEDIQLNTWYDITMVVDYGAQTISAWIGDRPADAKMVDFYASQKGMVEQMTAFAIQSASNASGESDPRGVFISNIGFGTWSALADFPAAGGGGEGTPPPPPGGNGDKESAKTGDNFNLIAILALLALSGAGFFVLKRKLA
jgi:LPXTG-motif cell wall-anchored protein